MLGWHVSVFKQADGGFRHAQLGGAEGPRLAVWQTKVDGLHWLDELVKKGTVIDLGGNGYPSSYTGLAKDLIPWIISGPPDAREAWLAGPDDILLPNWEGRTAIDEAVVNSCRPDEWLLVVAWDES